MTVQLQGCRICGSPLIQASLETVCGSCGAVQEGGSDASPILRRQGARSPDLVDVSLGSFLGTGDVASGKFAGLGFEGSSVRYMKVLSDQGVRSGPSKRQAYVLGIVDRLGEALGLTQAVLLEAQHLAAIKSKEGGSSKRRGSAVAAYSVMMASRRHGQLGLTWQRILQGLGSTGHPTTWKKILAIGIEGRTFNVRAGLDEQLKAAVEALTSIQTAKGFYISEARELSDEFYRVALGLVDVVGRERLGGYDPRTLAWSLLFLAEERILGFDGWDGRHLLVIKPLAKALGLSFYTMREQVSTVREMLRKAGSQSPGRLGESGESQPARSQAGRVAGPSPVDASSFPHA